MAKKLKTIIDKLVVTKPQADKENLTRERQWEHEEANEKKIVPVLNQDKVTDLVNLTFDHKGPCVWNWTDTYLETEVHGKRKKLFIDRYYPELKIAIDKFYTISDLDNGFIDLKKRLLNQNGIRYVTLTPTVSFDEAITKANLQGISKK
jgi:hypothetical protein